MADQAGEAGAERARAGRTLPLNSRRLTASIVNRIAKALSLPHSASLDDTKQMVEGTLVERGEEPRNVQVTLIEGVGGVVIELWNEDGAFLTIEPESEIEREHEEPGTGGAVGAETAGEDEDGTESDSRSREAELETELNRLTEENTALQEEVSGLRDGMEEARRKYKELWRMNCEQLVEHDGSLAAKEDEVASLKKRIAELEACGVLPESEAVLRPGMRASPASEAVRKLGMSPSPASGAISSSLSASLTERKTASHVTRFPSEPTPRRGKAPPIDPFDGERAETFDDWLPTLQRAAVWNGWSEEETLMQLAGYLCKRALQEWNLLTEEEKKTFPVAVTALQGRLDSSNRVLAAQDFRHAAQREGETAAEFMRRLEQIYRVAYGRDRMSTETRDILLFNQLQGGLKYDLMKAPAVSGAQGYQQLCLAARNEERRLIDLERRRQYSQPRPVSPPTQGSRGRELNAAANSFVPRNREGAGEVRRCFKCRQMGHLAKDCRALGTESSGPSIARGRFANTKQVQAREEDAPKKLKELTALDLLYSSDSDGEIHQIRVEYHGSSPRHARIEVQGVPTEGVIDSGADITIMGGDLFKQVASVARLKKKNFKPADKIPRAYDQRPFSLDGRIDLDITFCGTTLKTPVYVKLDAPEQMLLSEGVCQQLGIISYHPEILLAQNKRTGIPAVREETRGDKKERTRIPAVREETRGDEKERTRSPAVREETQGDEKERTRIPAVREETRGDKEERTRSPAIREEIRGDKEERTRSPAVREETRGDKKERTRIPAVREETRGDKEERTRSPAVRKETRGDKKERTRIPAVREETRGDKKERTRIPAVREETRGDKEKRTRSPAIREEIRGDKEERTRSPAVREETRGDKKERTRSPAVREETRGDKEERTRSPAIREETRGDEKERTRSPAIREETRGDKKERTRIPAVREETRGDKKERTRIPAVREETRGDKEKRTRSPAIREEI